jgi:hypothetical protein
VPDHRKHDRDHFFKYTSATTAVKILESSAVRYSSPILFNDPFDVQSGLHFDFDIDLLPDKLLDRIGVPERLNIVVLVIAGHHPPCAEACRPSARRTQVNDLQRSRVWSEVVRPAPIGRSRGSTRPE